ncbi:hypothetical protein FRZ67_11680 [Panacibacter ginsenosidivorans]|uniref:Uncharacterized protein n=1 Tax=Panacibacter ginsenosidivorans TaxID=1813871 RepID=A0A5B8VCB7_9BACT|nr:hypothetical protein [Panacibacter ginsenosidivorans]QEC67928.1 hypothetical protein FRZ67_11680 [Panacibacter ginsenosidivorans]
MAQLLITHASTKHHYLQIASIKQYNEPDFEKKLKRHATKIFENYYVFNFKFELSCDAIPGKKFEPDLILVSKNFTKWVIVEVELCKPPTEHTRNQITCFSNPKFKPDDLVEYILKEDPSLSPLKDEFIKCVSNIPPDLIVVLDDYSEKVFKKFYEHKKQLKICVMEVYKRIGYIYEGYRFGGDYPYELTRFSKLKYSDEQHYEVMKRDFAKDLPHEFEAKYDMDPFKITVIKSGKTTYLKFDHNIPEDVYMVLGISLGGDYILQKL